MSRRIIIGLTVAVPGLVAGISGARAADAYLCGPDRVVYVETSELEEKKRTDPCIASYYGLEVVAKVDPQPQPKPPEPAKVRLDELKSAPPAPVQTKSEKPTVTNNAPTARAALVPQDQPGTTIATSVKATPPAKPVVALKSLKIGNESAAKSPALPVKQAALETRVVASSGTDFRNVRVINAQSGTQTWYYHDK